MCETKVEKKEKATTHQNLVNDQIQFQYVWLSSTWTMKYANRIKIL